MKKNRRKGIAKPKFGRLEMEGTAVNDASVDGNTGDCKRWWIAVNGSSVAASPFELPTSVVVSPTPQQLLGFRTREEQLETQRFLLSAPIKEVGEYMENTVPSKIGSGEILYQRPSCPEPQPNGPTLWSVVPKQGKANDHGDKSGERLLDWMKDRWGDAAMN